VTAYDDLFRETDELRTAGSCPSMVVTDSALTWTCRVCAATRGPTIVDPPTGRRLVISERKCALFLGVDHGNKPIMPQSLLAEVDSQRQREIDKLEACSPNQWVFEWALETPVAVPPPRYFQAVATAIALEPIPRECTRINLERVTFRPDLGTWLVEVTFRKDGRPVRKDWFVSTEYLFREWVNAEPRGRP
jgi:hypothetical protein